MTPEEAPGTRPGARGRAVDLCAIRRTDMVLDLLAGRRLPRPRSLGDCALVLLASLAADVDGAPVPGRIPGSPAIAGRPGAHGSLGLVDAGGTSRPLGRPVLGHPVPGHLVPESPGQRGQARWAAAAGRARWGRAAGGECGAGGSGHRRRAGRGSMHDGTGWRGGGRWGHNPAPGRRVAGAPARLSARHRRVPGPWARSLATGLLVTGMLTRLGGYGQRH